jgi:uncharacterized membrane protein
MQTNIRKAIQPRLDLKAQPMDRLLDMLSWGILFLHWYLIISQYGDLPAEIPAHFDAKGNIDGYSHKSMLFFLPSLVTLLLSGLTILNRFPHIFNFPVKITPENAERQYRLACRFLRFIQLLISLMFCLISFGILGAASGDSMFSSLLLLPIILGFSFIPLVLYMIQAGKKGKLG